MTRAIDLVLQSRYDEIWKMCCGYVNLDIETFMIIQKRLLKGQIEALNKSRLGRKIMGEAWPFDVRDFRREVPLTTYAAYCPELADKRENTLPEKPSQWVHTSGKSGEFKCKWIPMSQGFVDQLGKIIYGIGLMSACERWGDPSPVIKCPNMIYTVAPRPYMSGALASILQEQTPLRYYPSLSRAEQLPFEERISLAFKEALSGGIDYFFGLSLVLAEVGKKFDSSAGSIDILPLLSRPKALARLTRAMIRSRMSNRNMLPKDLWRIKGIITSGLDSSIYREKIKEYWGRYPLDIYSNTEAGIIATQCWDYSSMTFIPHLNFLEFITEKEHMKWRLDHHYQPSTVLLDEVRAGECYEIVITNFHKGALVRYRVGDMIRITSLMNNNLDIKIPQMVFERRADDLLDFASIRLNERSIWKAVENTGVPYQDWMAFKKPGEMVLNILLEPREEIRVDLKDLETSVYREIMKEEYEAFSGSQARSDADSMAKLEVKIVLLAPGTFARYTAVRRSEGADIAHLKPPHVNPSQKVLSIILGAQDSTGSASGQSLSGQIPTPVI
ncbi:MAG: GH3 auxin-responsive promoter family protein [Dehalococcoidales bacterium]|nr:GH3 auxin-responsive promoter family protein [Dehalococcoidales bacterium]